MTRIARNWAATSATPASARATAAARDSRELARNFAIVVWFENTSMLVAMELGCDGVLMNTAIAEAKEPVMMPRAMAEPDFTALRREMVERQIAARGIDDPRLLDAFRAVPREQFVAPEYQVRVYDDGPLPIGYGQTISQPYIVALTIAAAGIKAGDTVLEVGAGSGYAAAVIGQIAGGVIAIERVPELAALAAGRMERLGYRNVRVVEGDGTLGYPQDAPYDAIVAAASGSHVPKLLIDQLKPGGLLVMPVGSRFWVQSLVRIAKHSDGSTSREELCSVRFVPLIGADA